MSASALDEIKSVFEDNGYKVSMDANQIIISRRHSFLAMFLYSLVALITIPLLFTGDFRVLLLVVLLLGFPFIYRKWMFPGKVVISGAEKTVFLNKNLKQSPAISFDDIQQLEVDEQIISSDVSPFKEGYQDYVYVFKIKTLDDKTHDLFSLEFRKPMDALIGTVFNYFDRIMGVTGPQPSLVED